MSNNSPESQKLTEHPTNSTANLLADLPTRLESVEKQLAALEQSITKQNRIQFKANTRSETQEQQTATALTTLQEVVKRQEQLLEERLIEAQKQLAKMRTQARSELAIDLIPVLDGIESALDKGYLLLQRRQLQRPAPVLDTPPVPTPVPLNFWQRLKFVFTGRPMLETPAPIIQTVFVSESDEALAAWLKGLELVKERFLSLLTAEGIRPIATDQLFDPRLHIALEAVSKSELPPGSIVTVLRKGYRQEDRVLRYAEVVVVQKLKEEK